MNGPIWFRTNSNSLDIFFVRMGDDIGPIKKTLSVGLPAKYSCARVERTNNSMNKKIMSWPEYYNNNTYVYELISQWR